MNFSFGGRIVAVATLVGSLLLVGNVSSVGAATAVTPPRCNALHFDANSSVTTRPGGADVRLIFTSTYFPTCNWSGATTYQFVASSGVAFGSKVSLATTKGLAVPAQPWDVNDTYQVVQNIQTEEGVLCTQRQAAAVAVTSPGSAPHLVKLSKSLSVCVNGPTKWTSLSSLSFPKPSACTTTSLKLTVGQSDGTAGTIFYPLIFTNDGTSACSVLGTPDVQPVTGSLANVAHILVGPQATQRDTGSQGYGDSIRLAPGATSSAAFGVVETGNFTPSQCVAANFESLSVGFLGSGNWWVPLASTTCTKLASTNISGIVPGTTGIAP